MKLSIVIPCYNSEQSLGEVAQGAVKEAEKLGLDYELLLINDCSSDRTLSVIKDLCARDEKIKGISFSKNFGQSSAILAAFGKLTGDLVLCMDDDGQSPIQCLPAMLEKLEEGYDVVYAKYDSFHKSLFRKFASKVNSFMASKLTSKPKHISVASFFLMHAFVAKSVIGYAGPYPYLSGLIFRVTANAANVPAPIRPENTVNPDILFRNFSLWLNGFTAFSVKAAPDSLGTWIYHLYRRVRLRCLYGRAKTVEVGHCH